MDPLRSFDRGNPAARISTDRKSRTESRNLPARGRPEPRQCRLLAALKNPDWRSENSHEVQSGEPSCSPGSGLVLGNGTDPPAQPLLLSAYVAQYRRKPVIMSSMPNRSAFIPSTRSP